MTANHMRLHRLIRNLRTRRSMVDTLAFVWDSLLGPKYGSLEPLTSQKRRQAKELTQQTAKLEIQVKALTQQRDNARTAVEVVREHALLEVKRAGQQLAQEMLEAGQLAKELIEGTVLSRENYANLRNEDAAMRENIKVAEVLLPALASHVVSAKKHESRHSFFRLLRPVNP